MKFKYLIETEDGEVEGSNDATLIRLIKNKPEFLVYNLEEGTVWDGDGWKELDEADPEFHFSSEELDEEGRMGGDSND